MSYTNDWSDTVPIDHTKFKNMPGAVRTLRDDIEDRFKNLFYGWISGETQTTEGVKALPYVAQAGDPGAVTGKMMLYSRYSKTTINYTFTVTSANATAGATYTNNGQTFTVINTISGATTLQTNGTGAPAASGTLTNASGTGDSTITFSAFSHATFATELYAQDEKNNVIQLTLNGVVNSTPLTTILSTIFYVGFILEEITGVNPATTYGFGTWVLWGAGRVSVTIDITDYVFVITSGNATVGATYTNNGQTFTVKQTIAGGLTLETSGTGAPSASGTLTKASGTGDATLTFSGFSSDFGTVEQTGGTKTKDLSHNHSLPSIESVSWNTGNNGAGSNDSDAALRGDTSGATVTTGGSTTQDILMPYITSYKWKRTA